MSEIDRLMPVVKSVGRSSGQSFLESFSEYHEKVQLSRENVITGPVFVTSSLKQASHLFHPVGATGITLS